MLFEKLLIKCYSKPLKMESFMDPNNYLNFQYDRNYFFIVKTEKEEPTTSALKTLKDIEIVMRLNLTYRPEVDDEFSKLPSNLLRAKLKDVAKDIKTQFHKEASHASFFESFFGEISLQEKAIQAVYNRIENLVSPPTFDLPNDAIENILAHLDLKDIAIVKQVSKTSDELSKEVEINRARDYGFQGKDYKEAKQYLLNLYQGIKGYIKSPELRGRGIFVMKGKWYSEHLDVEATLKNIKALSTALKNEVVNVLKRNLDHYLIKNSEEDLQSIKNNCALLNMFAVKLDDYLLKRIGQQDANPKIIQILLDSGADVNARDKDGITPLIFATANQLNPEIFKLLLASRAHINDKDKDGKTPLMIMAKYNPNPEILKLLLASDADVNATDKDGMTPLLFALKYNPSPEIIELLVKNGARTDVADKDGNTAFNLLFKYFKKT